MIIIVMAEEAFVSGVLFRKFIARNISGKGGRESIRGMQKGRKDREANEKDGVGGDATNKTFLRPETEKAQVKETPTS